MPSSRAMRVAFVGGLHAQRRLNSGIDYLFEQIIAISLAVVDHDPSLLLPATTVLIHHRQAPRNDQKMVSELRDIALVARRHRRGFCSNMAATRMIAVLPDSVAAFDCVALRCF